MSSRGFLLKLILVICILCLIILINKLETPWSQKVGLYLKYNLSAESGLTLNDFKKIEFSQFKLAQDLSRWTEQIYTTLGNKLDQLTDRLKDQFNQLISG